MLLSFFRFSSFLPFLDVLFTSLELKVVNIWANVSDLVEDGHNHELNEASLTSSNIGGSSVTHHGDIKALSLLHVSLVKELVEEEICPVGTEIEWSERSGDITGMETNTRNQLLGFFDSLFTGSVNKEVPVFGLGNSELVQVVLEIFSQLLHGRHVGKDDGFYDSFLDEADFGSGEMA